MQILDEVNDVRDAAESLRVIRDTMERSTRYSSLSGVAGLLIGAWAIMGVLLTYSIEHGPGAKSSHLWNPIDILAIWSAVVAVSALTDYVFNKRRAPRVGKRILSPLGARIAQAAGPSFFACFAMTMFTLKTTGSLDHIWGQWMMLYGLAICSVGVFSVRPVSVLGAAFVLAGAVTLAAMPISYGLPMMAVAFGGFHMAYGLWTGIVRGDW